MKILGASIGIALLSSGGNSKKPSAQSALNQLKKFDEIEEDDPRLYPILLKMWMHLGLSEERAKRYIRDEVPWSAAMVSWNFRMFPDFPKSAAHAVYALRSKSNKQKGIGKFWLERPNTYKPKVGDIVLKGRSGARVTYDNLKANHPTHGDIVVKVYPDHLMTIGGNVSNEIEHTNVKIKNGYIADPKYFAIVRNKH